jgi:hypothetical protein
MKNFEQLFHMALVDFQRLLKSDTYPGKAREITELQDRIDKLLAEYENRDSKSDPAEIVNTLIQSDN